jgi:hypothetical protein
VLLVPSFSLLHRAESQLALPAHDNMAKKRTAEERAAHSRHHATWRKRVRAEADAAKPAEEMSERLKALYAVAPRIGPDGKPLTDHTRRDEATSGTPARRSRLSSATTPPTSTPPPPDQAPATATATAGKVSLDDMAKLMLRGVLTPESCLKLHRDEIPNQPVAAVTTAPPLGPFADLRTSYASTAIAQPDTQISTGLSASSVPLPRPETAENDLGGFDASFFLNEDINPTLAGIQTGAGPGSASEVPPPQPQIQDSTQESVAPSLGSCQNSPLVPTASEQDSSTPLITAEDMLATAMPHFSPACRV